MVDGSAAMGLEVAIRATSANTIAIITTMPLGSAAAGRNVRRREPNVGSTSVCNVVRFRFPKPRTPPPGRVDCAGCLDATAGELADRDLVDFLELRVRRLGPALDEGLDLTFIPITVPRTLLFFGFYTAIRTFHIQIA